MSLLAGIGLCFLPLAVLILAGLPLRRFSFFFALGAVLYGLAAVVAAALPQLFLEPLSSRLSGMPGLLCSSFVQVALIEETVKLLMVWLHSRIRTRSVSERSFLSSALLVALSFSSFENIVYLLNNPSALALRFVTAVPLHAAATVLAASFFLARHEGRTGGIRALLSFLAVVGLHGFYNLCMELDGEFLVAALACLLVLVSGAYYAWGRAPAEAD